MRRIYRGLPKPGHSVIEGYSLDALPGTPVRSPFFARYLGVENVLVPSAGAVEVRDRQRARPVALFTDLLQVDPSGAPGGLIEESPRAPDEARWLTPLRLLLARLAERRILTVLPADQHLNPDWVDRSAMTRLRLNRQLLTAAERRVVDRDDTLQRKQGDGERLTVGEYEAVFGQVVDKEDRNFIPHCYEGVVEYIPSILQLLQTQRDDLQRQVQAGTSIPVPWIFPDFKTGLSCLSSPNRRGMDGNALRDILIASQADLYFDGPQRTHDRLAIVGGTAHEYSVSELIRFLIDLDYTVVWLLGSTGGLGIDSKLATAAHLRERYGRKLFATYDWPLPELLGPAPDGWHRACAAVRAEDLSFHEAWLEEQTLQWSRGAAMQTSLGAPVIHDDALLRETLINP